MVVVLPVFIVSDAEFRPAAVPHLLDGCHGLMQTSHWEPREALCCDSPDCVK